MRTSTATAVLLLLAALLATMFWFTMRPAPESESTEAQSNREFTITETKEPRTEHPTVYVATSSSLGEYLVATNGMTLYMFSKDATNTSSCIEQCAVNWPPYIVSATEPLLADDAISSRLSTIARDDDTVQLTFDSKPLYFFKNDTNAGETKGQGLNKVWYIVMP
jgi:predicted lipoprotein with Yx(FWY)xxD motif